MQSDTLEEWYAIKFCFKLGKNATDGNEGVLRIPQSSSIAGTSPSDCLGHSLGVGSYPSAEKQSVYSTAPAFPKAPALLEPHHQIV